MKPIKISLEGLRTFQDVSTRPDFWWVWIMNTILSIPLYITYFQAVFTEEEVADPIASVGILSFYIIFLSSDIHTEYRSKSSSFT